MQLKQQQTPKVSNKCAKSSKNACNHYDSATQAKLVDKTYVDHLDSDTEYRLNYIKHSIERLTGVPVPQMLHVGEGKFEGISTHHDDYKNFGKVEKAKYIIPGKNLDSKTNAKFDGISVHHQDYIKFDKYKRPIPHQEPEYISAKDDRDFSSVQHADFKNHGKVEKAKYIIPEKNLDTKNNAKFEGTSVHQQDYIKFDQYKVPTPHREPDFVSTKDDRDFNSVQHADFKDHGRVEKAKYIIPEKNLDTRNNAKFDAVSVQKQDFKKFDQYKVPTPHREPDFISAQDDRDFNSTHHADFKNHGKVDKAKYIIPGKNLEARSDVKFEGQSVQKQDYKKFDQYKVPTPHREPDFVSAQDDRDFNSTHHADFKNHGKVDKAKYIIPGKNLEARSDVKFEGQSVQKQDYKKFDQYKVPTPHREPDFVSAQDDRDFNSTQHADFKNHGKVDKAKYIIPGKNLEARSDVKFEGQSVQKQDYKKFDQYKVPTPHREPDFVSAQDDRDFNSTQHADFKNHGKQQKVKYIIPEKNLDARSSAKFDAVSVQKQDYKKFDQYKVPTPHREPDFVSAQDDRDFNSTQHADFKNHGRVEKAKYIIPGKNLDSKSNAKFEGTSVHHQDYVKFDKYQRPIPHQAPDYICAKDDRDFSSVHHADFKNHGNVEKAKYIIPGKNLEARSDVKFDAVSVQKQDYKKFDQYKVPTPHREPDFVSAQDDRDFNSTQHADFKNHGKVDKAKYIIPGKNLEARSDVKFEGQSVQKQDYKKFDQYKVPTPHREPDYVSAQDDRDFNSTHHSDFKNHGKQQKVKYIIPGKNLEARTDVKFEGQSVHQQDFKKFDQYKVPTPHREPDFVSAQDDRDFNSTHHADFKNHGKVDKAKYIIPGKNLEARSDVKFEGQSVQKQDYKKFDQYKVPTPHREPDFVSAQDDRDFNSTQHADFKNHGKQQKVKYIIPEKNLDTRSSAKFDAVSVQKQDFKKFDQYKVPTPHREPDYVSAQEERDFKTTASSTYQKLPMSKTNMFKPKHVMLPEQSLDGKSCTKEDYKQWTVPPRYQKPRAQYKPSESHLDGNTTYNVAYTPDVYSKSVKAKAVGPKYSPIESGKFEGASTARSDFQAHKTERTKSFAPHLVYNPAPEDRDFKSVSGLEYGKRFVPRSEAKSESHSAPASQSNVAATSSVAV